MPGCVKEKMMVLTNIDCYFASDLSSPCQRNLTIKGKEIPSETLQLLPVPSFTERLLTETKHSTKCLFDKEKKEVYGQDIKRIGQS